MSKKQSAVSHSTPEAEIVALDHVVRIMLLPAMTLWDTILRRPVVAQVCEDNQACYQVCKTGLNPTMRHLERTHKCNIRWLHERYKEEEYELLKIDTHAQAADIFTKPFVDPAYWTAVKSMIFVVDVKKYWEKRLIGGGTAISLLHIHLGGPLLTRFLTIGTLIPDTTCMAHGCQLSHAANMVRSRHPHSCVGAVHRYANVTMICASPVIQRTS